MSWTNLGVKHDHERLGWVRTLGHARCDAELGQRDRWGSTALRDALSGRHMGCAQLLHVLDDLGDDPDPTLIQARAWKELLESDCQLLKGVDVMLTVVSNVGHDAAPRSARRAPGTRAAGAWMDSAFWRGRHALELMRWKMPPCTCREGGLVQGVRTEAGGHC